MLLPETKGKPIEDNIKAIIPNLEEKSESNLIYLFHAFHSFQRVSSKTTEGRSQEFRKCLINFCFACFFFNSIKV